MTKIAISRERVKLPSKFTCRFHELEAQHGKLAPLVEVDLSSKDVIQLKVFLKSSLVIFSFILT